MADAMISNIYEVKNILILRFQGRKFENFQK